jgi:hypothetical protein
LIGYVTASSPNGSATAFSVSRALPDSLLLVRRNVLFPLAGAADGQGQMLQGER